jgi:hypothetical protein
MKKTIILLTFLFAITSQLFSSENKQSEYLFDIQYKHIFAIADINISILKKLDNKNWIGGQIGLPLDWDGSRPPYPSSGGMALFGITHIYSLSTFKDFTPNWYLQHGINYSARERHQGSDVNMFNYHMDILKTFQITTNATISFNLGLTAIIHASRETGYDEDFNEVYDSEWFAGFLPSFGLKYGYYIR